MELISAPATPTESERYSPRTPSLIKFVAENQVYGFDFKQADIPGQSRFTTFGASTLEPEAARTDAEGSTDSISISMPISPVQTQLQCEKTGLFRDLRELFFCNDTTKSAAAPMSSPQILPIKSHPLPIPSAKKVLPQGNDSLKDEIFDSFKTRSGILERQMSNLLGGRNRGDTNSQQKKEMETLHVGRYFDALEGPELDTLRASEETVLPEDKKLPFLLRYPVSSFSICLGVSSQAIMWKALAVSPSTQFLKISLHVNLALWCISIALVAFVSSIYILKMIYYFEAVRREYFHPIRVNFFFSPWIALLFLALGAPPCLSRILPESIWYVLMTPIFCLELKIYGQWMSGGERRLSKVANPSNHLAILGNFVGALLGASMGLKEGPIFFFAVGLVHYIVLFVTLYQRLPTNATLPKDLHPVFFLFVAAPSIASMAWASIQGSFENGSRMAYFVSMFLYFSLAVRIDFFRGIRFSLAWWAYTFPVTAAAIATIKYSTVATNTVTKCLTVVLCSIATFTVMALLVRTVFHAFVLQDLFPNDIAIAISDKRPKSTRRWHIIQSASKEIEQNDVEAQAPSTKASSVTIPNVTK